MATDVDYATLYSSLESRGEIPYASSEALTPARGLFQGMYLDLGQIQAKVVAAAEPPPLVMVYADVLNVPAATVWAVTDPALFIAARRVQVGAAAKVELDHGAKPGGNLVVFSDEVEGEIEVSAAFPEREPASFTIAKAPPQGGVQIGFDAEGASEKQRSWAQGMAIPPEETFERALITEFIFASLLYDEEPEIAVAQLAWIKNWAAEAPQLLGLFYRSGALLSLLTSQLNAAANGAAFVPFLTGALYTKLAQDFVAEAQQYESEYRQLATQETVDDGFIKQAKVLLANQVSQSQYTKQLLAQALNNFENATAAVLAAETKFGEAKLEAELAETNFKLQGIPAWKEKKIIEGVINLGLAIISFGVSIAAMVEGGGEGAGASAEAAVDSVVQVEKAAEAGSKLAEMAKNLEKSLESLKNTIELLEAVYKFALGIAAVAKEFANAGQTAEELKGMDLSSGGAALTSTYQWESYRNAADQSIAEPIAQGIEYAATLKIGVDNVAIYGQAVAAAQLAAITASQNYAAVALQVALAAEEQKTLEKYVAELEAGEPPIALMMQRFYQRYIDAKSSLVAAVEDYRASYFYWALSQSHTKVSLIEGVTDLDAGLSTLTSITLDEVEALEHFSPPPQELTGVQLVIEDPTVLAELREKGAATFAVGFDSAFDGLDRVRLTCVRAWIEGAKPASGSVVGLQLRTSGVYLDRYRKTQYQFMSRPVERGFIYEVSKHSQGSAWEFEDGSYGRVEVDGKVDEEVAYAYFRPTPFATWTIEAKDASKVKFDAASRVAMVFIGSAIG